MHWLRQPQVPSTHLNTSQLPALGHPPGRVEIGQLAPGAVGRAVALAGPEPPHPVVAAHHEQPPLVAHAPDPRPPGGHVARQEPPPLRQGAVHLDRPVEKLGIWRHAVL